MGSTPEAAAQPSAGLSDDDLIAVLDHLPALVACWDENLRNVFANRTFADWFATTRAQMRGRHLRDVIGAEAFAQRESAIRAALSGTAQRFDRVLVDSTGRQRHLQLEFVPRIIDGTPHGFFALGTDITAHVAATDALRDSAEALAILNDREKVAAQVNALVTRRLYTAILELSASLQPGPVPPNDRVDVAIEEIEAAIKEMRSLLLRRD